MLGLGSISSMGIGLAVVMDDQFTKVAQNVRKELNLLGKDTKDFNAGLARLENFGMGMQRAGDKILSIGTEAFMVYARFDDIVNSTRSIIGGIAKNSKEYQGLSNQARDLAVQWGDVADNVANAQLELAKAGKTRAEVMDMTEAVVVLGAASETAVNGNMGAAVMLSDIMNIYGVGAKESMKFANLLTSAANRSTIDVKDFYQSLKYSADIAKQLQIPVEETSAVIAAMGNAGLKGSMGGVAYANMLRYLSKAVSPFASKKQKTALGMLGITPNELRTAQGTLKPMAEILNLFRERAKGLNPVDLQNTLGEIFNVRGNRGFEPLLNGFADAEGKMGDFEKMYQQIQDDLKSGIAFTTAKEKTDDPLFDVNRLKSAWRDLQIQIGQTLGPALRPFLQMATSFLIKIKELMNTNFGKWLVRATFMLGGVGLSFLGRVIVTGTRFMAYMMTSAGKMEWAFKTGEIAGRSIRANLVAGANALVAASLKAKGITSFMGVGGPMLVGRNAAGRFATGAVKSNFISKALGTMFGFKGLRWASAIMGWFKPIVSGIGWLGKVFGWFKLLGGVLGKVFGWLFGWEAMLVDLISTLLTGKGLFEWLWEGIKWLGGLMGIGGGSDDEKTKMATKKFKYEGEVTDDHSVQKTGVIGQKEVQSMIFKHPQKQTINITVNPTTGDSRTQRRINLDTEQALNSYNIN